MKKFKVVPLNEITNEAREIAVAWVDNLRDEGGIMIQQKHKLASDIMNYAKNENKELREALEGIVDIGKRDMSNPKYDPYFETAYKILGRKFTHSKGFITEKH